jgi:hypothetical protein
MAQRRPSRKKRISRHKPEKYNPQNRAVRNRVVRRWVEKQKRKKGEKEWKAVLYVIGGIFLALIIMVKLYYMISAHEELEHH